MQSDSKDIIDELLHLQEFGVMNVSEHVAATDLLGRAIAEIRFLRGMAGAVTQGETFGDIKKRTVTTIAELEAILKEDNAAVVIHPDGTVTRTHKVPDAS